MLNKDNYLFLIDEAKTLYEKSKGDTLKDFPENIRNEFLENGNRTNFEKLYFRRRDYLSATAILALFDDSYIGELEKIILAVCNEKNWMLPAHIIHGDDFVDLFIAETAFVLAEISTVFSGRLSLEIHSLVKERIRKNLLDNYLSGAFWWEECNMNWASVCGGFIGGTLLYLFPEEFQEHKARILKTLSCYIAGFAEDGFCLEGPSYWLYGFMAYSVFADLLYKFTDGEEDLLRDDKVRAIASYGGKCHLKGNTSLSFSDADEKFRMDFSLQHFLESRLPDTISAMDGSQLCLYEANTKWMNYYRAILWQNDSAETSSHKTSEIYSPFANQLIINKDLYSFAIKGGNNAEPHNHNDLGSFIFSDKDGQVFCDLGAGRYTKDYFDETKRYGIFCNSSLSHSVPLIDGKPQGAGKNFYAELSYINGTAVCNMTKAYDSEKLSSLARKAELKENCVVITDSFVISEDISLTERFVSKRKAQLKDGELIFAGTKLKYPADKVTLKISQEKHTPHEYDKEDITVYCYNFILEKSIREISFEIITE